jgi:hypothetical protein
MVLGRNGVEVQRCQSFAECFTDTTKKVGFNNCIKNTDSSLSEEPPACMMGNMGIGCRLSTNSKASKGFPYLLTLLWMKPELVS